MESPDRGSLIYQVSRQANLDGVRNKFMPQYSRALGQFLQRRLSILQPIQGGSQFNGSASGFSSLTSRFA